jgi:hypothetical protein
MPYGLGPLWTLVNPVSGRGQPEDSSWARFRAGVPGTDHHGDLVVAYDRLLNAWTCRGSGLSKPHETGSPGRALTPRALASAARAPKPTHFRELDVECPSLDEAERCVSW